MRKTVTIEENIENLILALFNAQECSVGLVIGQMQAQQAYVLHLAATPKTVPEQEDSGKAYKTTYLNAINTEWIATHAKQVERMLPGGLDILGIYVAAGPEAIKESQAKLKELMFAVYKNGENISGLSERMQLTICQVTKKISCKVFNVTDKKSTGLPAECKFLHFNDNMIRLQTSVTINMQILVPNSDLSKSLETQILKGIQPFCDNIVNSVALIGGHVMTGSMTLIPPTHSVRRDKKSQDISGQTLFIELYENLTEPVQDAEPLCMTECGAKLSLQGTMMCRAFVGSKATQDEAVAALKMDIVRSVRSRCQLLCEDFLQTEEEQDKLVLYQTPLRVFAPLNDCSIQLCDYIFPDETNNDVVDRFKELLDITIPEDTLEINCETCPDNLELDKTEEKFEDLESFTSNFNAAERSGFQTIMILLGLGAGLLSFIIMLMIKSEA